MELLLQGGNDSVLRTIDGGMTWNHMMLPDRESLTPIYFGVHTLSPETCLLWGIRDTSETDTQRNHVIYRTEDAGKHWSAFFIPDSVSPDEEIYNDPKFYYAGLPAIMTFTDTLHGIAIGYRNTYRVGGGKSVVMLTDDGGRTWNTVIHQERCHAVLLFSSVSFADKNNGMATGNQVMFMRTTDGGYTWKDECIDPLIYLDLTGVAFKTPTWALGVASTGQVAKWLPPPVAGIRQPDYSDPTGVSDMSLSPNPGSGQVTLRYYLKMPSTVRLSILDQTGREVLPSVTEPGVQAAGDHTMNLRLESLASGTYFVRIIAGRATVIAPLVLER